MNGLCIFFLQAVIGLRNKIYLRHCKVRLSLSHKWLFKDTSCVLRLLNKIQTLEYSETVNQKMQVTILKYGCVSLRNSWLCGRLDGFTT